LAKRKKVFCIKCKHLEIKETTEFCYAGKGFIVYPDSWLAPGKKVQCGTVCDPSEKNRLNDCKDFEEITILK